MDVTVHPPSQREVVSVGEVVERLRMDSNVTNRFGLTRTGVFI